MSSSIVIVKRLQTLCRLGVKVEALKAIKSKAVKSSQRKVSKVKGWKYE
jgi:hypothetical protein